MQERLERIGTVVVVVISSTLKLEYSPGNVRLSKGEADLPQPCVANVSQIATIDRSQILRKIGTLSRRRLIEVVGGIAAMMGAEDLLL